jgi:hypothetical protein
MAKLRAGGSFPIMSNMDDLIERARVEAAVELRARLRDQLLTQPREWLVEQLVNTVMERLGLGSILDAEQGDVPEAPVPVTYQARPVDLDAAALAELIARYEALDRQRLEAEGYLVNPPAKGGPLIDAVHRTEAGEELLAAAKDLLYALLFGEEKDGVQLARLERELLTLTVPRTKVGVFSFLSCAATEIGAQGTWQDPGGAADDARASNTLLQVEYGEAAGELVGGGIVAALKLINDLEINEVVLYVRMENAEQSTLS